MKEKNNKPALSESAPEEPTEPLSMGRKANMDTKITGTKGWLSFLGVLLIISGALALIFSLVIVSFSRWLLGIQPPSSSWILIVSVLAYTGVSIYLGVLLLSSSRQAKAYLLRNSEDHLLRYHTKMYVLFKAIGIVVIIGIALWLISLIVSAVL